MTKHNKAEEEKTSAYEELGYGRVKNTKPTPAYTHTKPTEAATKLRNICDVIRQTKIRK